MGAGDREPAKYFLITRVARATVARATVSRGTPGGGGVRAKRTAKHTPHQLYTYPPNENRRFFHFGSRVAAGVSAGQ